MGELTSQSKSSLSVDQATLSGSSKKAKVKTRKSPLNIRKDANGNSTKIGSLRNGSEFNWSEEKNSWLKINANGKEGWVSKAYTSEKDSSLSVDANAEPALLNELVVLGRKQPVKMPKAPAASKTDADAEKAAAQVKAADESQAGSDQDIKAPSATVVAALSRKAVHLDVSQSILKKPENLTEKVSESKDANQLTADVPALGLLKPEQLESAKTWTSQQNYDANVVACIQNIIGRNATGTFSDADFQSIATWQNANSLTADGCFGGGCFRKASSLGIDMPNVHVLGSATPHWCNNHDGFHTETSLDKLSSKFQPQAKAVLGALTKAGVGYKISCTLRDVGRSRMMFLARYFGDPSKRDKAMTDIKARYGIYVFGTTESAASANKAFGCGSNVVGYNSNHNSGDAVDFSLSGAIKSGIDLQVGDKVCRTGTESDSRLKLYNAIKNSVPHFIWWNAVQGHSKKDDPHWSYTGN